MKCSKIEYFLSKKSGRAIAEYGLIEDGDRVLVAVSGGKDSLTLLDILRKRQGRVPIKYYLFVAHIITDNKCNACMDEKGELRAYMDRNNLPYAVKKIDLRKNSRREKISCFWCSWNRRKALFELASQKGCNKIALGHHMDDAAETMLMNLFFNGEVSSMNAKQVLFGGKITIIRPLIYLTEKETASYAGKTGLPVLPCNCFNSRMNKRALMKDVISGLERVSRDVKKNIFMAPRRIKWDYLGEGDEKGIYKSVAGSGS